MVEKLVALANFSDSLSLRGYPQAPWCCARCIILPQHTPGRCGVHMGGGEQRGGMDIQCLQFGPLSGDPRPLNGEPRPFNDEPRPLNGESGPLNGEPRPLNGEPRGLGNRLKTPPLPWSCNGGCAGHLSTRPSSLGQVGIESSGPFIGPPKKIWG